VKQLVQPSTRYVLDFPSDWHSAEDQWFWNLEFFNRIGRYLPAASLVTDIPLSVE